MQVGGLPEFTLTFIFIEHGGLEGIGNSGEPLGLPIQFQPTMHIDELLLLHLRVKVAHMP